MFPCMHCACLRRIPRAPGAGEPSFALPWPAAAECAAPPRTVHRNLMVGAPSGKPRTLHGGEAVGFRRPGDGEMNRRRSPRFHAATIFVLRFETKLTEDFCRIHCAFPTGYDHHAGSASIYMIRPSGSGCRETNSSRNRCDLSTVRSHSYKRLRIGRIRTPSAAIL